MNEVFQPYLRKFVLVFFDDILVHKPSVEEHLQHLDTVLGILQEHQLYANEKFGRKKVEYLGHVNFEKGVATDQSKIVVMADWLIQPQAALGIFGAQGLLQAIRVMLCQSGLALNWAARERSFQVGW